MVIEKAGHKCLFLPKFHCELNPIKMVWDQAKQHEYFPYFKNVFLLSDQKLQAFMGLHMEHLAKPIHLFQSALNTSLPPTFEDIFNIVIDTWMHTSVLIYTSHYIFTNSFNMDGPQYLISCICCEEVHLPQAH